LIIAFVVYISIVNAITVAIASGDIVKYQFTDRRRVVQVILATCGYCIGNIVLWSVLLSRLGGIL
jgi:hypothetical protein